MGVGQVGRVGLLSLTGSRGAPTAGGGYAETPAAGTPDVVLSLDEATAKQTWQGFMIEGQIAAFGASNQMYDEAGGFLNDLTSPELTRLNSDLLGYGHGMRVFRYAAGLFPQRAENAAGTRLLEHYAPTGSLVAGSDQVDTGASGASQHQQFVSHFNAAGYDTLYYQHWRLPSAYMTAAPAGAPNAPSKASDAAAYWAWIDDLTDDTVANVQYACTGVTNMERLWFGLQNEAGNTDLGAYSHCRYTSTSPDHRQLYVDIMRVLIPKMDAATFGPNAIPGTEVVYTADSWDGSTGSIGARIRGAAGDGNTLLEPDGTTAYSGGGTVLSRLGHWAAHNISDYAQDADTIATGQIASSGGNTLLKAITDEFEHFDGQRTIHVSAPYQVTAVGGETNINPAGVTDWAPEDRSLVTRTRGGSTVTLVRDTDYTESVGGGAVLSINLTGAGAAQAGDVYNLGTDYYPDGEEFMFGNLGLVVLNTMTRWNAETACTPIHALKPTYDGVGNLGFCLAEWKPPATTTNITSIANATGDSDFDALAAGAWDYNKRNWNVMRGFLRHLPWDSVRYAGSVSSGALTSDQAWTAYKSDGAWIVVYVNRSDAVFTFEHSQAADRDFLIYTYDIDTSTANDPTPTITHATAADGLAVDVPAWSIVFAVQDGEDSISLSALSLDDDTIAENASVGGVVGAVVGKTSGSTLSLTDDAGGLFALDGLNIEVASALDYETATSHDITLRETLTGATNTPRDTVITINVSDVAEGGGGSYDADSETYFAQVVTNGGAALDTSHKDAVDDLVLALKTGAVSGSNIWAKLDRLFLYQNAHDIAARTSLKSPGAAITATNAPTFTTDDGYEASASNSRLDTGFTPSTAGGNYAQDSAHLGFWSLEDIQAATDGDCGINATPGVFIRARSTSDRMVTRINAGTNLTSTGAVTSSLGHFVINRSGASAVQQYHDAVQVGTGTTTSTGLPSNPIYGLGTSSSVASAMRKQGAFHFGGSLTANEVTDVKNALSAYLAAI